MYLEEQRNGFRVYQESEHGEDDYTVVAEIEVFVSDEADKISIIVTRLEDDPKIDPTITLTVL